MPQGLESITYGLIQNKIATKHELENDYTLDEVIRLFCVSFVGAEVMQETFKIKQFAKGGKHF